MSTIATTIRDLCLLLRLNGFLEAYKDLADKCSKTESSYSEFLCQLLKYEQKSREDKSQSTILKLAKFPKIKTLEDFDFSTSNVNKIQIQELATLQFIGNHENILLLGASGVGKTHLACSLGYLAVQQRIKTKFIAAADLVLQLETAKKSGNLSKFLNKIIGGNKLLIVDEFGYVKFDESQANLFFQLVNKRYETGSMIITSNLGFLKWQDILNKDEALTTAILDRLIHHSHILHINGDSYRLRQKKANMLPLTNKQDL